MSKSDTGKLNFVCLGGFTYPSGLAGTKRVQRFIDYLLKEKNEVIVITLGNVDDLKSHNKPKGKYKGVSYFNLGSSLPSIYFYYLLIPFFWIRAIIKILALKKKSCKNILYVYNSFSLDNIVVIFFCKLAGYKVIVDIVEDYSVHVEKVSFVLSLKLKANIFFEKHINNFANGIVVLSSYLENRFKKISDNKIPIVNIPISADVNPSSARSKFNSPITFSYSGSFGKKDGLSYFLEAYKRIIKKHPDCILYLSGKGNNPEQFVKNGNENKIKYLGYLTDEEYYKLIKDSDILCMTRVNSGYANAGFPFKLGEYLATGNPVISSNVSDVSKYLTNGEDALIINPENVDELTDAIDYLISNPEKAFTMASNGKKKCLKYFNPEVNGKKLADFARGLSDD
jgi:glycosyltransferase involved in cell wall biosynthesis